MNQNKINILKKMIEFCCKKGSFTLTSGKKSDFYINLKQIMFDPISLKLLGEILYSRICGFHNSSEPFSVGGLELGSVPLCFAISIYSISNDERVINTFIIRKYKREHGTGLPIEGIENVKNKHVVIIDDVLTTGGSLIKSANAIRDAGGIIDFACVVVDREENDFDKSNIDFDIISLFKRSDLDIR